MVKYCPYCGRDKIEHVGLMPIGDIFKCLLCKLRFVVVEPEDI